MQNLRNFVGKQVFLFGSDVEDDMAIDLEISTTLSQIIQKLHKIPVETTNDIKLIHGIFTSALCIPDKIEENTNIYLIFEKANILGESYIFPLDNDIDALKIIVETITNSKLLENIVASNDYSLSDQLYSIDKQEIEDLFIVYGCELDLFYHANLKIKNENITTNLKMFDKIKKFQ